ncbi:ABC transporter permease [Roseovarius sp. TE539]|uniref:ABC transporter permease n=1 Tax=Roseovarius sp. TE539 TaxID=2249812 RepID=UPI000DE1159D|nr:ABC transporter permease [Roseovarius sp. TE539]RBI75238.1 ABC transporter permease [Roseovarius sp. TE539]
MLSYALRRVAMSVPALLVTALIIFLLLDLAPGDPMAQVPLSVPPEIKERMREALGLGEPTHIRFGKWLWQFFAVEPMVWLDAVLGTDLAQDRQRVISWQTRSPVMDIVVERMPQTLWVVGMAYVLGILVALPIGILAAYRQYSVFDQVGTLLTLVGYSVPPFFSGVLAIVIFSVHLGWLPSIYDTTHRVTDWHSFTIQVRQMILPVMVLAVQTTAQISRFMRAAMLDSLRQDYVRTARAKGLNEWTVVLVHVLRNSMIPVITIIALGLPQVFGGAIITEQIFKVNGLGQLLITSIMAGDLPMVQTVTFMLAVLIVAFNIVADLLYGLLDPRIRHD